MKLFGVYRLVLGSEVCLGGDQPKLSAAIITPSLNFRATTEVPVTMGC